MKYSEFTKKRQEELSLFPMKFAFNQEQFGKVLQFFGMTEDEAKEKLCKTSSGGFIRKSDKQALKDLYTKLEQEKTKALEDDSFMIEAIKYELMNHEYCVTEDPYDALNALGLDAEDERVSKCLQIAKQGIRVCAW